MCTYFTSFNTFSKIFGFVSKHYGGGSCSLLLHTPQSFWTRPRAVEKTDTILPKRHDSLRGLDAPALHIFFASAPYLSVDT